MLNEIKSYTTSHMQNTIKYKQCTLAVLHSSPAVYNVSMYCLYMMLFCMACSVAPNLPLTHCSVVYMYKHNVSVYCFYMMVDALGWTLHFVYNHHVQTLQTKQHYKHRYKQHYKHDTNNSTSMIQTTTTNMIGTTLQT